MGPALAGFLADLGLALTKWGLSELIREGEQAKEAADKKKAEGVRDEANLKKYSEATTRAEQIRAGVDLINRNN